MKKILTIVLSIVTVFSFTGCDKDDIIEVRTNNAIADYLDGIWEGEVANTYLSYRWRGRGVEEVTEYYPVDMEFMTDPNTYANGTGVETDYIYMNNRTGYCEYVKINFDFEVRGRNIYIHYYDGYDDFSDSYVAIYDFVLTENRFEGELHEYNKPGDYQTYGNKITTFAFTKVANWKYYRNDYYIPWTRGGEPKKITYKEIKIPFRN